MGQRMKVHHHVPPSFDGEDERAVRSPAPPAFQDDTPRSTWSITRLLRARRWTILTPIAIGMTLAALAVAQMTPVYSASTLIVVSNTGEGDARSVDAQAKLLLSSQFAERMVKQLDLVRDAELDPIRARRSLMSRLNPLRWFEKPPHSRVGAIANGDRIPPGVLNAFTKRLSVQPDAEASALRVSFESSSAAKAAKIVNAVAATYLAGTAPVQAAAPDAGVNAAHLDELAEQLRKSERALEQYKAESTGGGNSLAGEQLAELNGQIGAARAKLAQSEEKNRKVNSLYHTGGTAESIASVVNAPLIGKLRAEQKDLLSKEAELSVKYGDRHPQMIALHEEKQEIEVKIEAEVKRVIRQLATDVTNARARLKSLEDSRSEVAASDKPQGPSPERLRTLQDEIDANRAMYQTALTTAKTSKPIVQPSGARIVEPATVPQEPISPDKSLIFGGTFLGTAFLGFMLALAREGMVRGIRAGADIENIAGVANLAVLPKLPATKRAAETIVNKPISAFTEGIRSLHASLLMSNEERPPKVIVVTSSVPDEGKTSVAVSLGRLAAKGGMRVLLIDADFRHPSVGAQFSSRVPAAGLAEVLTGRRDLASVLQRDPMSPLEVLPIATPPVNAAELLSSAAMKKLVEVLRQYYNLIILDAAPVLPVADTRLLTRLADKFVYVVKWNATPRQAVSNGLRLLRQANADIAGTVLNQADLRRHAIYDNGASSYGYGSDGRYYSD